MITYIISGLTIGMAGSLHCIGMCGPLALSIPSGNSGGGLFLNSLIYNIGRSVTYSALGFMFGWLGNGFFIAGYQQWISIFTGAILLFIWITNYTDWFKFKLLNKFISKLQLFLNQLIIKSYHKNAALKIGLLNGLLPCGLVYVAVGASLTTGNPYSGAIMMFSFGLGTIPLMLTLMVTGKKMNFAFRQKLIRIVPVFVFCVSILLILRGLNLGIPYISPELNVEGTTPKMEHCK